MSVYNDCILWDTRVIVPAPARQTVLHELHEGHPGICKMKSLARMYVWWPGIDADIDKSVRLCQACQAVQSLPPHVPLTPWQWPSRPWTRLHLDFAGPFENHMFLVLIDAYSKWIETFVTSSSTSSTVIHHLRATFARFGLPETIVTDNGTCFVSGEFEAFLKSNGIRHVTSAPYHPASNGLAERSVQIIKRGLKKESKGDIHTRLAKVLFNYRISPQGTTGVTPTELLLGRKVRTRLDLMLPNVRERVERKQCNQKQVYDKDTKLRSFDLGSQVFVRNYGQGSKWLQGKVVEANSPMYIVHLKDGGEKRCHLNQMRHSINEELDMDFDSENVDEQLLIPSTSMPNVETSIVDSSIRNSSVNRYPSRNRLPPDRFIPS